MDLNLITSLPLSDSPTAGCSCCSQPAAGPSVKPMPSTVNDLSTAATAADYRVTGMTCGHCVSAVTAELTALPGVRGVNVDLVAGGTSTVTITSDTPIGDDQVAAALDEAGDYRLATH